MSIIAIMVLLIGEPAIMPLAAIPIVEGAKGWLTRRVGQGVEYVSFRLEQPQPIVVHALVCQKRFSGSFAAEPMLANIHSVGLKPIRDIVQDAQAFTGMKAIGAINGGYFMAGTGVYRMSPIGLFVWRGELISPPNSRSALVCWENGDIEIERLSGRVELLLKDATVPIVALNQGVVANGVTMFTSRFGRWTYCPSEWDAIQVVAKAHNLPLRPNGILRVTVISVTNGGSIEIPSDGIVIAARGKAVGTLSSVRVGDELEIRTEVQPAGAGISWAVGAGPRLVRDGNVSVEWREENFKPEMVSQQYPRSAVGLSEESIIFVAVAGDPIRGGIGINATQLAQLMVQLGCKEAMMLDCGSSTGMCVSDEVVVPSDGVPRPIANAIVVFNPMPIGEPTHIAIEPQVIHALPNARIPLRLWLEDDACHRVEMHGAIRFEVERGFSEVELGAIPTLKIADSQVGDAPAKFVLRAIDPTRGISGEAVVFVHRVPKVLIPIPRRIVLEPNERIKLHLLAETDDGYKLHYNPSDVRAEFDGELIEFDASAMTLSAKSNVGRTGLTLTLYGAKTHVDVHVGKRWVILEEFDSLKGISIRCVPSDGTVKANCELVSNPALSKGRALKFSFELGSGYITRAAYLVFNRPIGSPLKLRCAVHGDGSKVWLRAQIKDAIGRVFYLTLASSITWRGEWRSVEAAVPAEAIPPLTLNAIYVVATQSGALSGSIVLDQLAAQYPSE